MQTGTAVNPRYQNDWWPVTGDIWRAGLSASEKVVMLTLRKMSDNQTMQCWPRISTIAKVCGLSVRTVQYALHKLEQLGMITRQLRTKDTGDFTSSLYTIYDREADWSAPKNVAPILDQLKEFSLHRPAGSKRKSHLFHPGAMTDSDLQAACEEARNRGLLSGSASPAPEKSLSESLQASQAATGQAIFNSVHAGVQTSQENTASEIGKNAVSWLEESGANFFSRTDLVYIRQHIVPCLMPLTATERKNFLTLALQRYTQQHNKTSIRKPGSYFLTICSAISRDELNTSIESDCFTPGSAAPKADELRQTRRFLDLLMQQPDPKRS